MTNEVKPTEATPAAKQPNKSRRKIILIILTCLFLLCGLLYLCYWFLLGQYSESTDDAYVMGNLVQVSPLVSGTVTEIKAEDTQLVQQGQPLVYLDNTDAKIALTAAEANLGETARQVKQLYINVNQLKAKVLLEKSALLKAQSDLQRRQALIVNKAISVEDLQHAQITADSAQAELTLTQHQLNAAIALVSNSDLYHHPLVIAAVVRLRKAYLAYQRTIIYAPTSGYVAKRTVQLGQEVTPSSILLVIIPLDEVWVDANFKESQLKNIRIGQAATLYSDAYGSSVNYQGQVMGLAPGTGTAFALLPAQNATGNWIKIVQRLPVRIELKSQQLKKYPLRVGLSMTVTVDTHKRNGLMLQNTISDQALYQTSIYKEEAAAVNKLIITILNRNSDNISYSNDQTSEETKAQ